MKFSKIIATAALCVSAASAAMTSAQVVANIDVITVMSKKLQTPANSINILSGPLFLIGQGPFPQIVVGFSQIITTVGGYITAMQGTNPFSLRSDQDAILNSLTTFVTVHQQLLNILIGKAGITQNLPLIGPPVAQALRALEGVVDTIALGLIAMTPDVASDMTVQKNKLDVTIGVAIVAYTPII